MSDDLNFLALMLCLHSHMLPWNIATNLDFFAISFLEFSHGLPLYLAPLYEMLYLTTLEIPLFPLMSSKAISKLSYLLIINVTLH